MSTGKASQSLVNTIRIFKGLYVDKNFFEVSIPLHCGLIFGVDNLFEHGSVIIPVLFEEKFKQVKTMEDMDKLEHFDIELDVWFEDKFFEKNTSNLDDFFTFPNLANSNSDSTKNYVVVLKCSQAKPHKPPNNIVDLDIKNPKKLFTLENLINTIFHLCCKNDYNVIINCKELANQIIQKQFGITEDLFRTKLEYGFGLAFFAAWQLCEYLKK